MRGVQITLILLIALVALLIAGHRSVEDHLAEGILFDGRLGCYQISRATMPRVCEGQQVAQDRGG